MNYPNPQPFDLHRPPQGWDKGIIRGPMGVRPFVVNNTRSDMILPADDRRGYLLIQNNSSANMLVGIGAEPVDGQALILGPGVFWEPQSIPTNSIYIRSETLATGGQGIALFIVI